MIFSSSLGDFKGIINHLRKYSLPSVSVNAMLGSYNTINDFVFHKATSQIEYSNENNKSIAIIFDFCSYRVNVTDYIIETGSFGTPPVLWQLAGANDLDEKWTVIDSPPENDTLCPRGTSTQCIQRTITRWKCSTPSSTFRYIRFTVIKDRIKSNNVYLRLGGLEFYGKLYAASKNSCNVKSCKENKLFVYTIIAALLV